MPEERSRTTSPLSSRALAVALVFGAATLAVVRGHLVLPIPGTEVLTDPRELFTTLGAALSGPVGGVIIGLLAGIGVDNYPVASVIGHVAGALWIALAYKEIRKRFSSPAFWVGWIVIVLTFYYFFLIPGYVASRLLIYEREALISEWRNPAVGWGITFVSMYTDIVRGVPAEVLLTSVLTTTVMYALPGNYRRPLWYAGEED